ncbi:MAG TPA: FlgD immunoglobulin-like domain containing protein [bacterium]|nr:FlgD immunoglobulin-like domain containing protein [bacterium]
MADLVEEFFKRDLTEAEHEALAGLLGSSPDAALRYEGLLAENYLATGLPSPTLPRGLESLPGPGALGNVAWLKIALVAAGLTAAGLALWKFWPKPVLEVPAPGLQAPARPHPARPQAALPGREGEELSVMVKAPEKSLVSVRVLDGAGKEVRSLYTGFVEAGQWAFQWDGLLQDGRPAQAGNYLIDVRSGTAHLTKGIRIKVQPAISHGP